MSGAENLTAAVGYELVENDPNAISTSPHSNNPIIPLQSPLSIGFPLVRSAVIV
jgi:hypothetical protein